MDSETKLKRQRQVIKGSLTRIYTFCNDSSSDFEEIKVRVEKADELFKQFEIIQEEIDCLVEEKDIAEEEKYRTDIEHKYFTIKSVFGRLSHDLETNNTIVNNQVATNDIPQAIQALIDHQGTLGALLGRIAESDRSENSATPQNTNIVQNDMRLPRIEIPEFDGNSLGWIRFRDLFEAIIHQKSNISSVEKLQYLQTKLKGEALSLVKHLKLSNENYAIAWDILKKRFDNSDKVKNSYFDLLLDQPRLKSNSYSEIKQFYSNLNESFNALKALDEPVQQWDTILIYILERKLDEDTSILWYREKPRNTAASFKQFMEFLEKRVFEGESINKSGDVRKRNVARTFTTTMHTCLICSGDHVLFKCDRFRGMEIENKRKFVRENNICFNCLQRNHRAIDCKSSSCRRCGAKHNTLLHPPETGENQQSQNEIATTATATEMCISANTQLQNQQSVILLPTAMIMIRNKYNVLEPCRALLDTGSQRTLISESCVQRLQLKRCFDKTTVLGIGNSNGCQTKGKVDIEIISSNKTINTEALCMAKLTQFLPAYEITDTNLEFFNNLTLADPTYRKPGKIDVIIGADIYLDFCYPQKTIQHPCGYPSAIKTEFGWAVIGKASTQCDAQTVSTHVCLELDQQIQRFWEQEEIRAPTQHYTDEELQAEEHYKSNVQRNEQGQYIVRLPLKDNVVKLGESKTNALKRLYAMERKFKIDEQFKKEYEQFMKSYIELGHMDLANDTTQERVCFLPHHAVMKPTSSTTKLRVVFDASCKTSNGLSLNDNLLVGPVVQNDLFDIVIQFRKYEIGFTADIEKMYRQVLVHSEDQSLQRIVWRNTTDEQPKEYNLKTVTYGTSAAPFLATRTLNQIASDHAYQYPLACEVIRQSFYVDDFMFCAQSLDQAIELKDHVSTILSNSGLNLRKWSSNSPTFMQTIDVKDREQAMVAYIDESQTVSTLGILWDTKSDTFRYNVNLSSIPQNLTKRSILSDIARIFDPMGWLSPIVVYMKIFMQKLWLTGMGWDEALPTQLYNQWVQYHQKLNEIPKIKIQRWLHLSNNDHVELHGFADSSELAYAAAVYIKIKTLNGNVFVNLVAAKTRVAPVKQISLPRLELCAAVLMVKLMSKVQNALKLQNVTTHGWTDSTVVLYWISDHPRRWKTFIANRTSQIISVIPSQFWHHIQSKMNPADLATRGMSPSELIENQQWWHGPLILKESTTYPRNHADIPKLSNLEERKEIAVSVGITSTGDITQKYSEFMKMTRITALILRFVNNCKNKVKCIGALTISELQKAHDVLIKKSQLDSYKQEIKLISTNRTLPTTNILSSLSPFIDDEGILRVGGRIDNSSVSYNQKHPIILNRNHSLTKLLVNYYHLKHMHAGQRQLQYIIGLKYWVPAVIYLIKQCVYKCTTCMRYRSKTFQQQMGNIPRHRLQPGCAFINTGIDFAGPIQIRSWRGRGSKLYKCWIAIFVCLVTKAIHIELVTELSTPAFLASLRRFIARRGKPRIIYTDNGTNFVGCNQHLRDVYQFVNKTETQNQVSKELAEQQIDWHFSPPSGPHFGGIWEAGVKSIKFHLHRVLKDAHTTYEELCTVLCQIESCLNSRPLCTKFEGDGDPLTPGHFIIMRPMATIPDEDLTNVKENLLSRWQYLQKLVHQFWKKWSLEYISQLQQRPKWKQKLENIHIGDIVIIKSENTPPSQWALGRVSELHPGADGLVRVVTLKTAKGMLKRPIVKLCPLFMDI